MPTLEESLVPVATLAMGAAVLSAYGVRVARFGRASDARLAGERGTALLGRYPIEAFHWVLRLVSVTLERTKVSPDTLTLASLACPLGTIPLVATGHFEIAGLLLLAGSAFDAFDGIVARIRGIASDRGEMLDAVVDRYADAACLVGLAIYYRANVWFLAFTLLAIVGSMMVSYVRAKAETFGLDLPSGIMRRPERVAYLCGALIFGRISSSWLFSSDETRPVTLLAILAIGALSNVAAIRMLIEARRRLPARARRAT